MVRESLNHQIKHLVSMQYSTVELRHQALEDVLAGPYALHAQLPTKLAEVNALAQAVHRRAARGRPRRLPAGTPREAAAQGQGRDAEIPGRLSQLVTAGLAPIRQLRPVARRCRGSYPEAEITAMDAKWYRLARYDSAVVSMNDGTSAALYRRDPERFRDLLRKTHRDPRAAPPRVAAPGRGVPRRARRRSPRPRRGTRPSGPGPRALTE